MKKDIVHLTSAVLFASACTLYGRPAESINSYEEKPYIHRIRMDKLPASILSFDIANHSALAAAALNNLSVSVWSLNSGEVVRKMSFPEPDTDQRQKLANEFEPIYVRFDPDGKTLAVSFLSRIHLYDVETWREQGSFGVDGEDSLREDSNPKLTRRPASNQDHDQKSAISLDQLMKERAVLYMNGDGRTRVLDFAFTPDGSSVLAAYCRGGCYATVGRHWGAFPTGKDPVRLWDVRSARLLWEREYDPKGVISRVVPSPDRERFAAVNAQLGQCAVGVFDLRDGAPNYSLPFIHFTLDTPTLAFLPTGEYFITANTELGVGKKRTSQDLAVYATVDGKGVAVLSSREKARHADVPSDGRWLASASWDGSRFQVWDVQVRKPVLTEI
ncbi:MAG: WD40 repeat domain-containing protein, partial [Candidatus Acidiferrales bacterium]